MDTSPIIQNTPPGAPAPKKYIRTFEGDMDTVKRGDKPDLVPLNSAPKAEEPIVAEVPRPVPAESDVALHPDLAFIPTAPPSPVPKPEQRKPSPIKTYSYDFLQRMKETKASTATILAAEQDSSKENIYDTERKPFRGSVVYIISGVALLILGGSGGYITYTRYLAKTQPVTIAPAVSAPIFVNESEKISGTSPSEILQEIKQSVSRSLAQNTVRFLYTGSATSTDNSIFSSLQLSAPGILLRNIISTDSMAGIVSVRGGQYPFFILSVASYGDTFAGMLSWESTMARDLEQVFPKFAESNVAQATSTPVTRPAFRDEIISNHDVRIYRDTEGQSVILYGYWNKKTLIIARNEASFIEIVGRLATVRKQI
jgi:hypothetical protein